MFSRTEEGLEVSCLLDGPVIVVEGLAQPAEVEDRSAEVAVLVHDPEMSSPLVVLG